MTNRVIVGLALAVFFQFLVLSGMYVRSAIPLWTGTEVKVKIIPVDPRSMFRGNYARLRYEFSQVDSQYFSVSEKEKMRNGEVVYVTLKQGSNDLYEFSSVFLEKPESGTYLRGRVINRYDQIHVKYGIEAFFAPKEKALALEKELRNEAVAVLMVSNKGKAIIKDIISE